MNKADLVNIVAAESGLIKTDAAKAVDAVFDGIKGALSEGENISLVGFGSFVVSERAARTARNPRTGETINVGPSKGVRFKAGKALKDAVKS